ncbi:MAG TPA: hypothetical protein VK822_20575 [Acetobacteraceae bacterium]|nr:hypothetical protein [Acetobacteraceae bacterium]
MAWLGRDAGRCAEDVGGVRAAGSTDAIASGILVELAPWADVLTLPEDYELIAFFEAEPELLDPAVPGLYNTLTFVSVRGGLEVCCKISPSYGHLTLRLKMAGEDLPNVDIGCVDRIRLESRNGREALLATIDRDNDFVLQLKPHVCVVWSNAA